MRHILYLRLTLLHTTFYTVLFNQNIIIVLGETTMNLIEIKNILNLNKEQIAKLPTTEATDLIGNVGINVTVEKFIGFLDRICFEGTFKDQLIVEPNFINADLEKFIENKHEPLEFKYFLCNFVNPCLSEWFYVGEISKRTYVHFFKNGNFMAFRTEGTQVTAFSNCAPNTSTKEFNRLIGSVLTDNVLANIARRLNRQRPEALDNVIEFFLDEQAISESELYSIIGANQAKINKTKGWFKVITLRDGELFIALIHKGSNLVLWFTLAEGLLCIFKVATLNDGSESSMLNEAEKQMNEILTQKESEEELANDDLIEVLQQRGQEVHKQDQEVHIDFEKYDFSFGDKAIVLDLIEKLKEKINNSESEELGENYTNEIIDVASALIDEAQAIQSRVNFLERFKQDRVERFVDVKNERYDFPWRQSSDRRYRESRRDTRRDYDERGIRERRR